MYCKCDKPKKKIVRIDHNDINVCAKSIGGCGCEISSVNKLSNDVTYLSTKVDCYLCTGTGISIDWMSGQTSACLNCNGKGYV